MIKKQKQKPSLNCQSVPDVHTAGCNVVQTGTVVRAGNPDISAYITTAQSTSQATVNFQSPIHDHRYQLLKSFKDFFNNIALYFQSVSDL